MILHSLKPPLNMLQELALSHVGWDVKDGTLRSASVVTKLIGWFNNLRLNCIRVLTPLLIKNLMATHEFTY